MNSDVRRVEGSGPQAASPLIMAAGFKPSTLRSLTLRRDRITRAAHGTESSMSEHRATIRWSRRGADFGYKNYSLDHVWLFDNGVVVRGSAAPAYLGNPQLVDPESAFDAALSNCHMLTFLVLARSSANATPIIDSVVTSSISCASVNSSVAGCPLLPTP